MGPPVLLSTPPEHFSYAARVAQGIELKLDRQHAPDYDEGYTLTDACREQGLDPAAVTSVHLPPGTRKRYGMSVADGNIGKISDFTHTAFGEGVDPDWLTLHSARSFGYSAQVDRLGTITAVTGYPVALENPPDRGQLYAPEGMALVAFLADHVDRLDATSLVVDTDHVPDDRRGLSVDEDAVEEALARLDGEARGQVEDAFRAFLQDAMAGVETALDPGDPWRPSLTALYMTGGARVGAVHLNEPGEDGTPDIRDSVPDGMRAVVDFCRHHDVAIVLEPGQSEQREIEAALDWLDDYV
jgi:hypothetical protein